MFQTYAEAAEAMARGGLAAADPLVTPIAQARAQQDAYFAGFNRGLELAAGGTRDVTIAGPHGSLPLRLHFPGAASGDRPVIVFVRGAGFWAGGLASHARTMHTLARLTDCVVCGVDYRRAPEHRYPVQRDELLAALHWLGESRPKAGATVLFGESAGATICLSAAIALRDRGQPLPAGLVLFYANAGGPKPTARAYSQWVWRQYLGHEGPSADRCAVPLLDSLRGLPPVWLGAGEDDPLMADTLAIDDKLRQAGNRPALMCYPGLPHGFVMWTGTLAPALAALQDGADAARRFLGLAPLPRCAADNQEINPCNAGPPRRTR